MKRHLPDPGPDAALTVDALDAGYGPVQVLRGVTLHVGASDRVAVIGANGAGKTTLLRTVSGILRPRAGKITYGGLDLGQLPANNIVRVGVAQVPEGRQVFARQTVLDNLRLGAHCRRDPDGAEDDLEWILNLLEELGAGPKRRAADLSGGQQQILAIGRAIMSGPRVLMIDELSLGLSPLLAKRVAEIVLELTRRRQMALLIVEQNAGIALALSERTYAMKNGRIVGEYESHDLAGNRDLVLQYLGT